MRKLSKPRSTTYKFARLYRDDIESIHAIMSEYASETSSAVIVETDVSSYDSLEELFELKKEFITHLCIRGNGLNFDLEPYATTVFTRTDDPAISGYGAQINRILEHCKQPWGFKLLANVSLICALSICMLIISLFSKLLLKFDLSWVGLIVELGLLTMMIGGQWFVKDRRCMAFLKHKIDSPSFAKSNWDKIALAMISAFIGGLIMFGYQAILKHYVQ